MLQAGRQDLIHAETTVTIAPAGEVDPQIPKRPFGLQVMRVFRQGS